MTLASSGTMSIGGTTTDRSINLELGRSATATPCAKSHICCLTGNM